MKITYVKYWCLLLIAVLMTACGGGSDGGTSSKETLTGVFIDSPVKGLKWISGDMEGTTDAAGTFKYKTGDKVQFYVGDILLGEATGNSVLIPVDLVAGAQDITNPTVTNIIRFLMTLDNDNNPSNGIEITEAIANLAAGESVDFTQSSSDFAASGDTQVLISTLTSATDAGARALTSVSDAQTHVQNSIKDLLAGTYSGTFSGDSSGTWSGTITPSGVFSGTATSSIETVSFNGIVSTNGSGSTNFTTSGGASDGTTYSGTFNPNGSGSGTWSWFGSETGTWSGSKTSEYTSEVTYSVAGTLTLPVSVTEKSWAVAIDDDHDGSNGFVSVVDGVVTGTMFTYQLDNIASGTYYVYARLAQVGTALGPIVDGDYFFSACVTDDVCTISIDSDMTINGTMWVYH